MEFPMQRKLTIRLDYDAEGDYHKAIVEAARTAARTLLASTTLISQKRKPRMTVQTESYISGTEGIDIYEEENEDV
jgi:hypothetical protein